MGVLYPLYYWLVNRPSVFPYWLAFLAGIFLDLLIGRYLGLNALLFVLSALLITRQRRFLAAQSFMSQWALFLALCLMVETTRWAFLSLLHWSFFSVPSSLVSAVVTAALYPVATLVMAPVHRLMSRGISANRLS